MFIGFLLHSQYVWISILWDDHKAMSLPGPASSWQPSEIGASFVVFGPE